MAAGLSLQVCFLKLLHYVISDTPFHLIAHVARRQSGQQSQQQAKEQQFQVELNNAREQFTLLQGKLGNLATSEESKSELASMYQENLAETRAFRDERRKTEARQEGEACLLS